VQVLSHAFQESIYKVPPDFILMESVLECLENRVEAYFIVNGKIDFAFEIVEQRFFVIIVKCVNDFISQADKSIDAIDAMGDMGAILIFLWPVVDGLKKNIIFQNFRFVRIVL